MARKRLISRTPQTWIGTLGEALFGTAGRSVIVGNRWYRFSRSRGLVASPAALVKGRTELCVVDAGPAPASEARRLAAMVGARWSLLYNCATAFAPFWSRAMSQVSPGDRSSIARHVVLSVVAALAIVAAVLFGADMWMERKVQRIEARMEAQYRSVVVHLGQVKARLPD